MQTDGLLIKPEKRKRKPEGQSQIKLGCFKTTMWKADNQQINKQIKINKQINK